MQCQQFESRFHALLDQRCDPSSDLLLCEHLVECTTCQRMVAAHEALVNGLRLGEVNAPPEIAHRVVAQIELDRQTPRSRMAGMRRYALAATLLISISVLAWGLSRLNSPTPIAANQASTPGRMNHLKDSRTVESRSGTANSSRSTGPILGGDLGQPEIPNTERLLGRPSADQYIALVKQWGFAASQFTVGAISGSDEARTDHNFPNEVWVSQVADGFRPLAHSVSDTINVLRQAIPDGKPRLKKPQAKLLRRTPQGLI